MQIGFIDFSKEERNQILNTLKLLETPNALDALGIGVVRDAYANLLFPGISSAQTRAKYFVILPYLFAEANQQKGLNAKQMEQWFVKQQNELVKVLVENSAKDEKGIIGKNAIRNNTLVKNPPSSVYWSGLKSFEILLEPKLSFATACKLFVQNAKEQTAHSLHKGEDSMDDHGLRAMQSMFYSPLSIDYNLQTESSIRLTKTEAQYLQHKITHAQATKYSVLAQLIKKRILPNDFLSIPLELFEPCLRDEIFLAQQFSYLIRGAHIRYNLIFSGYQDEEQNKRWEEWLVTIEDKNFDVDAILSRVTSDMTIHHFCHTFLDYVSSNDIEAVDALIVQREYQVKGKRSKLHKPEEYRYEDRNPSFDFYLDYRYGTVKTIVEDIFTGLEESYENV